MKRFGALLYVNGTFFLFLSVPAVTGLSLFLRDMGVILVVLGGLGVSSIVKLNFASALITVSWGASTSPSTSELASGGSLLMTVISSLGRSLMDSLIGCWEETFVHIEGGL